MPKTSAIERNKKRIKLSAQFAAKLRRLADSIEDDFRRLIELLSRAAEFVASSDELAECLSATKAVADQGLELSRDLQRLAQRKSN